MIKGCVISHERVAVGDPVSQGCGAEMAMSMTWINQPCDLPSSCDVGSSSDWGLFD
jgi:hypothetical protein